MTQMTLLKLSGRLIRFLASGHTALFVLKGDLFLYYPEALVAKRGMYMYLANAVGIKGMAGVAAAPPAAAAGMGNGRLFSRR